MCALLSRRPAHNISDRPTEVMDENMASCRVEEYSTICFRVVEGLVVEIPDDDIMILHAFLDGPFADTAS